MAGRAKKSAGAARPPAPGGQVGGADALPTASETPVTSNPDADFPGAPRDDIPDAPDSNGAQVELDETAVKTGLLIKNSGPVAKFEPLTKTRIPAGETVRIESDDIEGVRKNILQMNVLARRKVLSEVDE